MPARLVQTSCALRDRSLVCGEQDQPAPDRARGEYRREVPRESQQTRGRATLRRRAIEACPYPPRGPQISAPREKPRFHTERSYILALQCSKRQVTTFR